MGPDSSQFDLSTEFQSRLLLMVQTRLVWHEHLQPWADEVIATLEEPPVWVLKLSTAASRDDVLSAIGDQLRADEPGIARVKLQMIPKRNPWSCEDEYVVCLFLRYRRGELSWATFLEKVVDWSDADNYFGRWRDGCFWRELKELIDAEYVFECEDRQRRDFEEAYGDVIASVERTYLPFLRYFRDAIRRRQG